MSDPVDMVNQPPHYAETRIECIDAIAAMIEQWPGEPAYFAGNVIKYVWRHRQKTPLESLKKAPWYLDRLIQHEEECQRLARLRDHESAGLRTQEKE